ncbi:MAG: hypothetical protein CMJ81_20685 [Planctomycetaceae bacterium]|nr:hypothetical protein [Planctomycetaceae bacterium]
MDFAKKIQLTNELFPMLFTRSILLAVIWSRNKNQFETRNDRWFNTLLQSISRTITNTTRDPGIRYVFMMKNCGFGVIDQLTCPLLL